MCSKIRCDGKSKNFGKIFGIQTVPLPNGNGERVLLLAVSIIAFWSVCHVISRIMISSAAEVDFCELGC
jgi:hypothetical protein